MKSIVLTAAAMIAAFALSADDDLKINGDFKGSNLGDASPAKWTKNFSTSPDIGKSTVVKGEKDGEFALQVTTGKRDTPFYSGAFKASAGDTLEITADVKGKGKIQFSYYAYNEKGQFLAGKGASLIDVNGDFAEYKSKIVIDEVKEKTVAFVRIVFSAAPNSDVTFKDVEAEIEAKK